jgi:Fe-S cluster assembly scaffold protein SufB
LERAFSAARIEPAASAATDVFESLLAALPNPILIDVARATPQELVIEAGISIKTRTEGTVKPRLSSEPSPSLSADEHLSLTLECVQPTVVDITIAPDRAVPAPIVVLNHHHQTRIDINVGARSRCTLVQLNHADAAVNLAQTVLHLHENSVVDSIVVNAHGATTLNLDHHIAEVHHNATLQQFQLDAAGWINRTRRDVHLLGAEASANVRALLAVSDQRHVHHYTQAVHHVKHTHSSQLTRGLGFENGKGSDQSVVHIKPFAAQSASTQSSRHLLIDESAQIHARPILEIFNHDVKASHGATVGSLDPQMAFYLRSRGLSQAQAQLLLQRAFWHQALPSTLTNELSSFIDDCLFRSVSAS